jgi:hypothetical protein
MKQTQANVEAEFFVELNDYIDDSDLGEPYFTDYGSD